MGVLGPWMIVRIVQSQPVRLIGENYAPREPPQFPCPGMKFIVRVVVYTSPVPASTICCSVSKELPELPLS